MGSEDGRRERTPQYTSDDRSGRPDPPRAAARAGPPEPAPARLYCVTWTSCEMLSSPIALRTVRVTV